MNELTSGRSMRVGWKQAMLPVPLCIDDPEAAPQPASTRGADQGLPREHTECRLRIQHRSEQRAIEFGQESFAGAFVLVTCASELLATASLTPPSTNSLQRDSGVLPTTSDREIAASQLTLVVHEPSTENVSDQGSGKSSTVRSPCNYVTRVRNVSGMQPTTE